MNKSPEEYFQEQNFSATDGGRSSFTPAEQAFMDKYLGVDGEAALARFGAAGEPVPDQHEEMAAEEPLEIMLRDSEELLMVGFFIGGQEYTIPTVAVQEVIRAMPLAKLPAAPEVVAGVINLRGKVTPLIHLRKLLGVTSAREQEDKFIIVCRRQGIQAGMIIERVHTMYRVAQKDIDWSVESHIGANVEFISGLLKLKEKLVSVVSVDSVIASILK